MRPQAHNGPKSLSVCLVEYNPLAAHRLRQLLETDPRLQLTFQDDAFKPKRVSKTLASVFVLDRGTLPTSLSKFLRVLHFRFRDAKTLLLGAPISSEELSRLLFLGIQGFLPYDQVEELLLEAIRAVADGDLWIAPKALKQYVRYTASFSRFRGHLAHLITPREHHIIELACRRMSNKEIASILKISEGTVKFHLSNLFAKLGVHDRQSAVELIAADTVGEALLQKSK